MKKNARIAIALTGIFVLQGFVTPAFAAGPSGTVNYNGQSIRVNDGQFNFNGMTGTIDIDGNFRLSDGTVGNITQLAGVSGYKIDGETAVTVGSNELFVSGTDRNGTYSRVDIRVLAKSMKDGSYVLDGPMVAGIATGVMGYTAAEFEQFKQFVRTHSVEEITAEIAKMPTDKIIAIDEWRPTAGNTGWRVSPEAIVKILLTNPESIAVAFEQAGIPLTHADLTRYYSMTNQQLEVELKKLTNDQLEKIQGRLATTKSNCSNNYAPNLASQCATPGWQDLSSFSPEVGRVVSPAEKDAIRRIKTYISLTVFNAGGEANNMSTLGKQNWDGTGWKRDAFKPYLTNAMIADYVAHPTKGEFMGGSGTNYKWGDGTISAGSGSGRTITDTSIPSTT